MQNTFYILTTGYTFCTAFGMIRLKHTIVLFGMINKYQWDIYLQNIVFGALHLVLQ